MPNNVRTIANLSILALILVLSGRLMADFGLLDFWALFDVPTIPIWLAAVACLAFPTLAYFGTLFTLEHQASDYFELQQIEKIKKLNSFKKVENLAVDKGGQRNWKSVALGWVQTTLDRTLFGSDPKSVFVRNNISRHSTTEYLLSGLVLSVAYALLGLFVTVPLDIRNLDSVSSYGLIPFLNAGLLPSVGLLSSSDTVAVGIAMTSVFWAYLGAYFYSLRSLLLRVNSRDATPGHFYALTVRLVASVSLALLLHHIVFGTLDTASRILPAAYFFCGVFPEVFMNYIWQKVKTFLNIEGSRPKESLLDRIDGISDVQIERLQEVGIDSAFALAVCDPIRTFVRLPYRLPQIIDWIDQALLILHFGGDGTTALRKIGVRSILGLVSFDPLGKTLTADIAPKVGMTADTFAAKWQAIIGTQPFIRLQELAQALAESEKS
jgi:hypothetical protein